MNSATPVTLRFALVVSLLFTVLPSLTAQTAGTGALAGTVKDGTGAVIPNVVINATNNDTGQERSATSGADGSYRLALLPPGTYKVRFSASGFWTRCAARSR